MAIRLLAAWWILLMALSPAGARSLLDDVRRYESFGVHRYGWPGAEAAFDWIAGELAAAGFAVAPQPFTMARQYELTSGTLDVAGRRLAVVPQWWMPESRASLRLTATLAAGGFERLTLPFDRGAYLNDSHRARLGDAFARKPQAVLLDIEHPSGEIFTYNVDQSSAPWPVPVILVAPKDRAVLDAAQRAGTPVTVEIAGRYRHDLAGRNVVARLDRGKGRWLVISTPVTSWFTSTCERGPGIAGFLALARQAARRLGNVDLVFVATAGHEIGHGGMARFLEDGAPSRADTLAWAHFGSSLACRDSVVRAINSSAALADTVDRHFAGIEGSRLIGDRAAVGELREVHRAGYARFFGMAGSHQFFHTPADSLAAVSEEELARVSEAFAATLAEIAATAK